MNETIETLTAERDALLAVVEYTLDYEAKLHAERDALLAEVERLREALMRVHNFPSHPGGHPADFSLDAECPADWRHGWITTVERIQEFALPALIRESRKTAALSAGEKE